jgi:hypothetical protein
MRGKMIKGSSKLTRKQRTLPPKLQKEIIKSNMKKKKKNGKKA